MSDPRDPDPAPPADDPLFEGGFTDPWAWDRLDAPAAPPPPPAPEAAEPVACWRCGSEGPPAGGRCRKCRARLTDEDDRPLRPRHDPNDHPPADGDGVLVTLVVAYGVMLLVSVMWGWVLLSGVGGGMNGDDFIVGTAVVEAAHAVLVLVALAKVGRSALPPVSAGVRAWAWVAGVPALLLLLGVGHLYMAAVREVVRPGLEPPAVPLTAVAVLLMCLQPAVVEELFFRYVAFGALYRATGLHATVWVSAVMFAGAHLYNPLGMPYLLLAGVVLGYARAWGGLALPMVLHFAHNFVVLFAGGG
jgi:membrane protease YdiL (CAAX protease family)